MNSNAVITVPSVSAIQHVRRMRGGSQAQLVRCSDGEFYVVKLKNNPQHIRVLANEMFAAQLAVAIGLPVPQAAIVEVAPSLASRPEFFIDQPDGQRLPCLPGKHFGSRYAINPMEGSVFDIFPSGKFCELRNLGDFAGVLAFDSWVGNCDQRQVVFCKTCRQRRYRTVFIDNGYCFGGADWKFPSKPHKGIRFPDYSAYEGVTGWESFEPWMSRIEAISQEAILAALRQAPDEWYGFDNDDLLRLSTELYDRKATVRDMVDSFRLSSSNPFPRWQR